MLQGQGRHAGFASVLLAGALTLAACGSDNNATDASAPGGGSGGGGSGKCASGTFNAEGSSAQANAMDEWIKGYQSKCPDATVNYNPSGSGSGVESFLAGKVDFAGSDSALDPAAEMPKANQRCAKGPAVDLPMVIGPVAVAYNIPGVTSLNLSPATIAGIFTSKISKWNDPAIAKDNPGAKLPSLAIQAMHRSDESGTTDNFAKFLQATAPSVWTTEPDKAWPGSAGGQGAKGSDGVTEAVKSSSGGIGYMELSYAENAHLSTAKVANGSGQFVKLTPASAAKTIDAAKVVGKGQDLSLQIDYATKAKGAYPIVLVTYEIACTKGLDTAKAAFVKAFLTYTASSEGQQAISGLGYAPLPSSVQEKVSKVVGALS